MTNDYRRGLIDGLREAARLHCLKCFKNEPYTVRNLDGTRLVFHIGTSGVSPCNAQRENARIAELEAAND